MCCTLSIHSMPLCSAVGRENLPTTNLYNFGIHDCGSACVQVHQSQKKLDKHSTFVVVVVETGTGTLIVLQRGIKRRDKRVGKVV